MATMHKPFSQINAYSMQNGLLLGFWVLAAQAAMLASFTHETLSLISALMFLFTPILLFVLTRKFRTTVAPEGVFTITQGFLHTFLTMLYASTWVAIGVFVYLTYFDKGYVFDAYEAYFTRPEVQDLLVQKEFQQQIAASLQGMTFEEVINGLRFIPPATYAGMIFYSNLMVAPVVSLLIALFLKRIK
ncbi:MAG: DUF4199 domain-containing protein [Bacteroidaceae bacterium]|nr:DUF4199 domain-containing protein [Bacteroidaceae bacterium]